MAKRTKPQKSLTQEPDSNIDVDSEATVDIGSEVPAMFGATPEKTKEQFSLVTNLPARFCSCGAQMDIVKATKKQHFSPKNKVTYIDVFQCRCPKCYRVKYVPYDKNDWKNRIEQ